MPRAQRAVVGLPFPRTRAVGGRGTPRFAPGAERALTDRPGHASQSNCKTRTRIESRFQQQRAHNCVRWHRPVRTKEGINVHAKLELSTKFHADRRGAWRALLCQSAEAHDKRARPQPWDAACGAHRQRRGWSRRAAGFGRCVRRSSEPRLLPTSEKPLGYTRQTRDASGHRAAGTTVSTAARPRR